VRDCKNVRIAPGYGSLLRLPWRIASTVGVMVQIASYLTMLILGQIAISQEGVTLSGATYRNLSEEIRGVYVFGVVSGLRASETFGGDKQVIDTFFRCVNGMSGEQQRAIVDRYLETHPQNWQYDMSVLVLYSFRDIITLDRGELMAKMKPVFVPRRWPVMLSREEITSLIAATRTPDLKHHTPLSVAYGAGLRASEVRHCPTP
jgi:hypothetical protein